MDDSEAWLRAEWKAAAARARLNPPPAQERPRHSPRVAPEKRAAFQADATDPRHGTTNGYRALECRCQHCREAQSANMRAFREKRR